MSSWWRNAELRALVEQLRGQVEDLKRRLDQNSTNSSCLPSSDSPFVKPAPKSLRRASGCKPGGCTLASGDDAGAGEQPEPATAS